MKLNTTFPTAWLKIVAVLLTPVLLQACASPNDVSLGLARFNVAAIVFDEGELISGLERQQLLNDMQVALVQRSRFGQVLLDRPKNKPPNVLLIEVRLIENKREFDAIRTTAHVDLTDIAAGSRLHSYTVSGVGSYDGDFGSISIGVVSDLIEQIADVIERRM